MFCQNHIMESPWVQLVRSVPSSWETWRQSLCYVTWADYNDDKQGWVQQSTQSQIREQDSNTQREPKLEMRLGPSCTILLHLLVCANSKPQTLFDGLSRAFGKVIQDVVRPKPAGSVNTRLGLLANDLGLDPTADSADSSSQQSADFTAGTNSGNNLSGRQTQQCCCEPLGSQCDVGVRILLVPGLLMLVRNPQQPENQA